MKNLIRTSMLLIFFLALGWLSNCGEGGNPDLDKAGINGEQLARLHCGSCHQFPDPARLDRETWRKGVLPRMGLYMGLKDAAHVQKITMQEAWEMFELGALPMEPLIDSLAWEKIWDFYSDTSPDSLGGSDPIYTNSLEFTARKVDLGLAGGALTTLVEWIPEQKLLYVGDGRNRLFRLNGKGEVTGQYNFNSPPVAVHPDKLGGAYILSIGIIQPNDQPGGELGYLTPEGKVQNLLGELSRPVDMAFADLDADGREDIVICNFGHLTGRLSWFRNLGKKQYKEEVLVDMPGALKTYILDFDADGKEDIITLMAQGDERIIVHYNEGGGRFRPEILLRFDPVFGSSYFEPLDFDDDGDLDLLYVNGDNADYSMVLKPYHGIRLFENVNGDFSEVFFIPYNGAYKAKTGDFDGDGDRDIAAISFFPNYLDQPGEGIVFFENNSSAGSKEYRFSPQLIRDAKEGRWLTMDCGDLDKDGKPDLVLGSFTYSRAPAPGEMRRKWVEEPVNLLFLYNQ